MFLLVPQIPDAGGDAEVTAGSPGKAGDVSIDIENWEVLTPFSPCVIRAGTLRFLLDNGAGATFQVPHAGGVCLSAQREQSWAFLILLSSWESFIPR